MANDIKFVVLGDAKNLEKSLAETSKKFTAMGKSLSRNVTLPMVALGAVFIKIASDAEETANKFDVVFASMKETAQDWTRTFGDSVGRATEDIQRFTSGLGDVLKPLGFTTEEAFKLSSKMTQLALDVASFNNRQDADVIRAFTSALTGERESLKTLGIVINEADVKQEAYTSGIARQGVALTKTQKAQATINLLYKNTADAQGDLIRTQESFANQLKRLQASTKELASDLGIILLPAATSLVSATTDLIENFNALNVGTKTLILTLAGILALVGPLLLTFGLMIKATGLLVVGSTGLAAALSAAVVPLLIIAAVGVTAFKGWDIGIAIGELKLVKKLFDDISFKLDLFGIKSKQQRLLEEERLNAIAVARAKAVREENADKIATLETQAIAQAEHEEKMKLLKQTTTDFIRENEDQLRLISETTTQLQLDDLIEKLRLQRDATINHLLLEREILDEAGVLTVEKEKEIDDKIKQERDSFRAIELRAENSQQKKLTAIQEKGAEIAKMINKDKLASLRDTLGQAAALNSKFGIAFQAVAIGEAIISTAAGVARALKDYPFPASIIVGGLVLAAGAIQIATIAAQSFAVGTPNVERDMVANVHKGETIIPETFASGLRSNKLTLSGPESGEGGRPMFDFTGATFNGVTQEFVEDVFTKASEMIDNRTLVFGV